MTTTVEWRSLNLSHFVKWSQTSCKTLKFLLEIFENLVFIIGILGLLNFVAGTLILPDNFPWSCKSQVVKRWVLESKTTKLESHCLQNMICLSSNWYECFSEIQTKKSQNDNFLSECRLRKLDTPQQILQKRKHMFSECPWPKNLTVWYILQKLGWSNPKTWKKAINLINL